MASDSDQIDLAVAVRRPLGLRALPELHPDEQPGGAAAVDHRHRQGTVRPALRLRVEPSTDKTVLRGGYGTFFEQENTDGRVNNNMVPFRLDETGINDLTQRRTMADFFHGKPLTTSAAPTIGATATSMKMGRNHHFNFGVQQQLEPEHRPRGELRRKHRAVPERVDQHQHPRARCGRRAGAPALPAVRQHQLLRHEHVEHLPFAPGLARPAGRRGPLVHGVLHVVEEHHHAEPPGRRRQHGPREGDLRLRHPPQPRGERRLGAAGGPRQALPRRRGRRDASPARGMADAGHPASCAAAGRSPPRSGRTGPTRAWARSGRTASGPGELDDPTVEKWFDPTAFVLPAQFTYGDSGGNILREGSLPEPRLLGVQALRRRTWSSARSAST